MLSKFKINRFSSTLFFVPMSFTPMSWNRCLNEKGIEQYKLFPENPSFVLCFDVSLPEISSDLQSTLTLPLPHGTARAPLSVPWH